MEREEIGEEIEYNEEKEEKGNEDASEFKENL